MTSTVWSSETSPFLHPRAYAADVDRDDLGSEEDGPRGVAEPFGGSHDVGPRPSGVGALESERVAFAEVALDLVVDKLAGGALERRVVGVATMLSRFGVAEDACRQLLKYERRGIPSMNPPPTEAIEMIASERRSAVLGWIDRELFAARAKSEAATTPAGRTRGYSKLLENISTLYMQLDHTEEIRTAELSVRQELDAVRLKVELDRAGKLEFRSQKKRACDAYLDALYLLRGDSIPDDEQQAEIDRIEAKIVALGGEVPLSADIDETPGPSGLDTFR